MRKSLTEPYCKLSHILAGIFGAYSLLFTAIMAIETPPYQNPDETNHFFRAEQISRFGVLPERLPNGVGGAFVDIGIVDTAVPFLTIPLHPERKVTRAIYGATNSVAWGRALTQVAFPNTVIYPPTLYLPAVVGIWIGKTIGSPVVRTLYIARIVNGICCTIIAAIAIALADGAALWFFAVLTLPMTLALFCAVSQDGMMIAGVALAASIIAVAKHAQAPVSDGRFAVLCLVLTAVCMARPPYVPIACLILIIPWRGLALRAIGIALVAAAAALWSLFALTIGGLDATLSVSDIDPARQIAAVFGHPFQVLAVLANTYHAYGLDYLEEIVGRLGTLDVSLSPVLHFVAWTTLGLAAVYSIAQAVRDRLVFLPVVALTLACGLASIILIFSIEYLTFSSVGRATIEGVQGRYFIEILLLLAIVTYHPDVHTKIGLSIASMVAIFSVNFYIFQVVRAITLRYYLR